MAAIIVRQQRIQRIAAQGITTLRVVVDRSLTSAGGPGAGTVVTIPVTVETASILLPQITLYETATAPDAVTQGAVYSAQLLNSNGFVVDTVPGFGAFQIRIVSAQTTWNEIREHNDFLALIQSAVANRLGLDTFPSIGQSVVTVIGAASDINLDTISLLFGSSPNPPGFRRNIATAQMEFSHDGLIWQAIGSGGGSGTVTSVGLALPGIFNVSGSPVTSSGTLTGTLANQNPNLFFAGPASGGAATPTFRAIVAADLPVFVGDSGAGGTTGAVPAPAAGDAAANKFLNADGTWKVLTSLTAPGLNTEVLFNDAGIIGADSGLTFDKTSALLSVATSLNVGNGSPIYWQGFYQPGYSGLQNISDYELPLNPTNYYYVGFSNVVNAKPSANTAPSIAADGIYNYVVVDGADSNNWAAIRAFDSVIDFYGTGNVGTAIGTRDQIYNESTGNITNVFGHQYYIANFGSGTITNAVGIQVQNDGGGPQVNVIGVQIEDHSGRGSSLSYNLWSKGSNSLNLFEGIIRVKDLQSTVAAAGSLGSATLPFKYVYLAGDSGTPGTNNFRFTGTVTAPRVVTFPDASGTVTLLGNSASGILDLIGSTRGSVLFRGAAGWTALVPGTAGHVLTSNGAGADPSYQAVSGGTPAGSGSELQARLNSTTFQAVTGSSSANGNISLVGQPIVGGGILLDLTPGAHTSVASETPDIHYRSRTISPNNSQTNWRFVRFDQQTISGGITITNPATVYIQDAPAAAGGATLTSPLALWVDAGNVRFDGFLGIGTNAPAATQFYVQAQSSANVTAQFDSSSGSTVDIFRVRRGTTSVFTLNLLGRALFTPQPTTSSVPYFDIVTPSDGSHSADTQVIGIRLGANATRTWNAGAGTFVEQSEIFVPRVTYAAGATETIGIASSFTIENAPAEGTNMTLSDSNALWIKAGKARFDDRIVVTSPAAGTVAGQFNSAASPITDILRATVNGSVTAGAYWGIASGGTAFGVRANVNATVGGTTTLNLANGNWQTVTMGAGDTTIALNNIPNSAFIAINIIQDATGSRLVTWPASIKWAGGVAPTLTTAANARDNFFFGSDGTNLYEIARALDVK